MFTPKQRAGVLLASPMTLYVAVFFLVPLVLLVIYSFSRFDLLTFSVQPGLTLQNYQALFSETYISSIVRSLFLTVVMTAGCVVLGFPVALTIARAPGKLKSALLLAVIVPYWISFVVRTYAWLDMLSANGAVTRTLINLHVVPEGTQLAYSNFAIAVGLLAGYLPLMILPMFMALDRIEASLIEAAADMGLKRRRVLWKVIIPLAMPGSVAGIILVGIPAMGEYTIPAILGGNKTLMAGNIVADQFLSTGNYPFGSAIASVLMAVMMVILVVNWSRVSKLEDIT